MTTAELVKALARQLGVSQKQARTLLDAYITSISGQLAEHHSVVIRNFGSFTIKNVAAKQRYIPAKESLCLIAAHQKLQFKAAKRLREEVNPVTTDE